MSQMRNHSRSPMTGTGLLNGRAVVEAEAVAFYTVAQLAVRWSICERQVRRFIDLGELLATRFSRSVRVSAAEVARLEANRLGVK